MSKIIGIDLGTTYSEVAVMENGRPKCIVDKTSNSAIIPSVVGINPSGELLVGEAALNQYITSPANTVRSIKRKMGSGEKVTMAGKEYAPPEISAMILRYLKRMAEDYLGEKVEKAVITVPAYFSDAQRQATKDAGEIADLEVVRIINEPTAAALAYGIDKEEDQFLLVYDLGGGTLDVSVIEKVGGVLEVRAAHGNNHLGGDDFDERLMKEVIKKFEELNKVDLSKDIKAMAQLNRLVEAGKKELSSQPFTRLYSSFIAKKGIFSSLHLDMEIARSEFVSLIDDLLESTKQSIDIALKDADLKPDRIDKILLVGGSTRIPAVSDLVSKHLGKVPHRDVHPELAVAYGAAVQASIIAGEEVNTVLVDVSPYTLGVEYATIKGHKLIPGFFRSIIKRNTTIPASASEVFYTIHPDQDTVDINVYQGDYNIASMNAYVGGFQFSGIAEPKEKGAPREIVIQFDYDVDGIIHVSAIDRQSSRKEKGLSIEQSQIKLSSEEKEKAKQSIQEMESKGADPGAMAKLIEKSEILYKKISEEKKDESLQEEVKKITEALKKGQEEGKSDESMIARLSELLYDHGIE